jgi:hypothetical protein
MAINVVKKLSPSDCRPARSPRYRFWSTISSSMVTSLTFFRATHLEIRLSGPLRGDSNHVSASVLGGPADLEAVLCGQ